jgi:Ran GTPase-activating protein (RanGAP) involved in mRNA processing and transport
MLAMPDLRLTSLDLSDNSFGSHESVLALARFLRSPQCSTLEHLNISMTQLGTEGLRLVSRAIRHSAAPLKSLDLSISDANVSATSSLAAALLSKPTLETVLLNHNFFRHAGGDLVFRTLAALPALLTASLNGTQLNSTSVPGAIKLIRAMGVRQGVKLNLNSNYFSDDAVEQLLEAGEDSHVALGTFDDNDADMEEEYYDEEYDDVEDEDQHEMQVEAALLSAAASEAGAAAASAAACDAAVAELAATVQTELKM